ncbi:DUF4062 domain-containing protein [Paraburkholderia graminis]|uniref:DUF4062 domain-containing protein n=1 Tax=Paraburkholderia graminis TaxID=60548 RepID=UPI0038BB4774
MDKKYQVFISSTFTDMKDERQAAVMAILDAGHIPAGMELFAAADQKQMNIIEKWIDQSDIFMLILGGRYGSIDPDSRKSYIQLEYEYAVKTQKPFFALYLTDTALDEKVSRQGRSVIEQDDSKAYKQFRTLVTSNMCAPVDHIKDIFIQARKSIEVLAKERELDGWVRASSVTKAVPHSAPSIEMFTDASDRYHVNEPHTEHNLSTVKIGIRNAGGGTLSNCKVYVERVEPPPNLPTAPRILLDTGVFQLRHDDPERLVEIAAHWDHIAMFRFCAPLPGGAFGNPFNLNDCGTRTFTVRVIATECERAAQFELETDESKRLRLKFLRYAD